MVNFSPSPLSSFNHYTIDLLFAKRQQHIVYFYIPSASEGRPAHQPDMTSGQYAHRHKLTSEAVISE